MKRSEVFIGLDVHKETIAVAIAESGRDGEVRYWGTMPNTTHHLGQLVTKLAKKHSKPVVFGTGCAAGRLGKAGVLRRLALCGLRCHSA